MTTTTKISDFAQRIKGLSDYRSDDHRLRSETASAFAALLEIVVERAPSAAGVEVLQAEVTDLRRQKSDLEVALAATMTAWHKDKAALESTVAAVTEENAKTREAYRVAFASELGAERARFTSAIDKATAERDVATKRADLAEATLESVRAAVTSTSVQAVPWSEATEPGCLYFDCESWGGCAYLMAIEGRSMWLSGPSDPDLELTLQLKKGDDRPASSSAPHALLVARDLGTDPEAWRAAMREHMAKVGK